VLAPDGLVLGLTIDDGELFERLLEEDTLPLRDGDLFALFTDGITEAMNAADDCFGEQRLCEMLESDTDRPSAELGARILDAVGAFAGDVPQHDDMTLILLRVTPRDGHG
jgi:sigma-B regulation protein RsbU (phosphoserine phosphatase)